MWFMAVILSLVKLRDYSLHDDFYCYLNCGTTFSMIENVVYRRVTIFVSFENFETKKVRGIS